MRIMRRRRAFVAGASLAVLACLCVAACGGSSTATNSANTSTTQSGARGARFAAVKECLQKQGITLPSQPPGGFGAGATRRPPGGGFFHLPEGVSRTKFQEALKKCGANFRRGGRFNGAAAKGALEKFAACMRENGVKLPKPNPSGNGPVFNTNGINTSSSAFKAAQTKCRSELPRPFGGAAGNGPPPGATGEVGPPGSAPPPGS